MKRLKALSIIGIFSLICSCIVSHKNQSMKDLNQLELFGWEWKVKQTDAIHGPGNNYWGGIELLDLDSSGISFTIEKNGDKTICSELISVREDFSYGTYVLHTEGLLNELDRNTVFGFFIYEKTKGNPGEIDIEFTKWNEASTENNLHFSIHSNGKTIKSKTLSSLSKLQESRATHIINWTKEGVYFGTFNDHIQFHDSLIKNMTLMVSPSVHQTGKFRVHINLWKYQKSGNQIEDLKIKISNFKYIPSNSIAK